MAKYFGVNNIEKKGASVQSFFGASKPNVRSDESIIMILNNGLYEIAVDVTEDKEYDYFYGLYSMGHYLSYKLYKISTDKLVDCPDEGRRSVR